MHTLYEQVIRPAKNSADQEPLAKFISTLADSQETLPVHTLGAQPSHGKGPTRTIGSLVRHGSTSPFCRHILSGLIRHFGVKKVFELGTSLGLTTLYLSLDPSVQVVTFEGNDYLAARAQQHFDRFGRQNIRICPGNIDQTLARELSHTIPDLVYLDANHRYAPTLNYVSRCLQRNARCVMVIGDIHWSAEMSRAWSDLCKDPHCRVSIDFYEMGILFYQQDITPGRYVL